MAAPGATPDSMWARRLPRELDSGHQATYPELFITALTGFLVVHDDAIRSWWIAQAALVPPGTRSGNARLKERTAQLRSLGASVELSLNRFQGENGASQLFTDLVGSYGRRNPGCVGQLCALFALLGEAEQPSKLITQQLGVIGAADGVSPDLAYDSSITGGSPPLIAADACVFPEDLQLISLHEKLFIRLLSPAVKTAPDALPTPPFEAVVYEAGVKGFDIATFIDWGLSSRGGAATPQGTPLVTREVPLGPRDYLRFVAAGAAASGIAHAALTPVRRKW